MTRKPDVFVGLASLYIVTMFMIFGIVPIVAPLKLWANGIAEIGILACAVLPPVILKWDLREVFPIKKPMLRQVFGTLIMWAGSMLVIGVASSITQFILPDKMAEISAATRSLMSSIPLAAALFVGAFMAAVCEEALYRGFLTHTFQNIRNKWVSIIMIGVLFGAAHLSPSLGLDVNLPVQFLPRAISGFFLAYIMLETRNLILPMLAHFIQDALATVTAYFAPAVPAVNSGTMLAGAGAMLILCAAALWLILWGSRLLKPREYNREHKTGKKVKILAIILSVLLFIAGLCVAVAAAHTAAHGM